ncbi:NO-inducible flavohemoprotein [uncultured Jannaschia sp.]|uniref:NO-inducible flavohemoprotein n=1 Tax=uncultured Jannaschia sp. TaxID=293347 RepID=UPI00262654A8|nr:NO-inducible flavohemoprotein [uncultured Jannaschia sp.]
MTGQLSSKTIEIVKATVPALEAHGLKITRAMYARLFENEEIRSLFNQSHHGETGSQPKALAGAILAYARNIDNLGILGAAVERIAQKHVGLQILSEHYPYVADALLRAIEDVLGDAATNDVLAAWGEAYWFLADLLIARETVLYDEIAATPGGWTGWREFCVEEKTPDSEIITSFILRPVDGGPVMAHRPGQYLTFWIEIPGQEPQKRNYSISAAPNGETYRISVKREPQGIVSGWLHEHAGTGTILKVSAPAGEFYLPEQPTRPVVLLSGGVGLTPMISMFEALAEQPSQVPVHYVHGALDGSVHAMGERVRRLAERSGSNATVFYERPRSEDREGENYDAAGRISTEWLTENTPIREADYFICGPKPFLRTFINGLAQAGVAQDRIHYEYFGPADELMSV